MKSKLTTDFTPMFQIYKEGITDRWITIFRKNCDYFNVKAKIEFYEWMGYTVRQLSTTK
jgi:hypothetical protein